MPLQSNLPTHCCPIISPYASYPGLQRNPICCDKSWKPSCIDLTSGQSIPSLNPDLLANFKCFSCYIERTLNCTCTWNVPFLKNKLDWTADFWASWPKMIVKPTGAIICTQPLDNGNYKMHWCICELLSLCCRDKIYFALRCVLDSLTWNMQGSY